MKLEEAIEIVTEWHWPDSTHPWSKMETALKLLIEAGKRIQLLRTKEYFGYDTTLPGETEETTPSHRLPLGGITLELSGETKD